MSKRTKNSTITSELSSKSPKTIRSERTSDDQKALKNYEMPQECLLSEDKMAKLCFIPKKIDKHQESRRLS